MADIDIVPKRRSSTWLWILMAIIVAVILMWALVVEPTHRAWAPCALAPRRCSTLRRPSLSRREQWGCREQPNSLQPAFFQDTRSICPSTCATLAQAASQSVAAITAISLAAWP